MGSGGTWWCGQFSFPRTNLLKESNPPELTRWIKRALVLNSDHVGNKQTLKRAAVTDLHLGTFFPQHVCVTGVTDFISLMPHICGPRERPSMCTIIPLRRKAPSEISRGWSCYDASMRWFRWQGWKDRGRLSYDQEHFPWQIAEPLSAGLLLATTNQISCVPAVWKYMWQCSGVLTYD